MSFLQVTDIYKRIETSDVLNGVSFSQNKTQNIAIAGETGSGKSTLLKSIAGFSQPDQGNVYFEGSRVEGPAEKLIPGHPGIAYLSQHYELLNNYRVEELLSWANELPEEEADKLFEICEIRHLLKRRTDKLSGGEKQRIAMARLLISSPRLLLLDEPFSNLDLIHKNTLKKVIKDIQEHLGTSCIICSHDPFDTLSWADEIIVLKNGKIAQHGTPQEIYKHPINEYVAGLFGSYNLIPADNAGIFGKFILAGSNLLIRPESFKIVSAESNDAIKGVVKKINFEGSLHELSVDIPGTSVSVKTIDNHYKEGDIVYLTLSAGDVWYM